MPAVKLPDLPGLTARPADAADVDALTDLIAACEIANDGVAEVHETDVRQDLDLAGTGDIVVVEGPAGLAAWATIHRERATADVHPEWRGRGLGAALLAWTEERARVAGATRLRQVVTDADRAAAELFAARGYRPIYTSWILEHRLGDEPPTVTIPQGITIRPYEASDAAAVYRVIEDAFNEWPGRTPTTFDAWAQHVIAHGSFAPDLSRVAFDGHELVGAALSDAYAGQDEGWVQQLATKASHRHRGIARALLQSAFAAFHATGRRQVGLSTSSHTGALSLYERVGMTVRRSYTAWGRELD